MKSPSPCALGVGLGCGSSGANSRRFP
ncbi:MAG: hypothetical protein K0S78_873, partial [Thermomicrobiales bacterium]|nr:hypothetical protein [Thermomicrobiales bacterium]